MDCLLQHPEPPGCLLHKKILPSRDDPCAVNSDSIRSQCGRDKQKSKLFGIRNMGMSPATPLSGAEVFCCIVKLLIVPPPELALLASELHYNTAFFKMQEKNQKNITFFLMFL